MLNETMCSLIGKLHNIVLIITLSTIRWTLLRNLYTHTTVACKRVLVFDVVIYIGSLAGLNRLFIVFTMTFRTKQFNFLCNWFTVSG